MLYAVPKANEDEINMQMWLVIGLFFFLPNKKVAKPNDFTTYIPYFQTSSAISLTKANLAHCCSSVNLLPISHEAKPH